MKYKGRPSGFLFFFYAQAQTFFEWFPRNLNC